MASEYALEVTPGGLGASFPTEPTYEGAKGRRDNVRSRSEDEQLERLDNRAGSTWPRILRREVTFDEHGRYATRTAWEVVPNGE